MSKTYKLSPQAFQRAVRGRTIVVVLVTVAMAAAYVLVGLWALHLGLSNLADVRTLTDLLSRFGGTLLGIGVGGAFMIFFVPASMQARKALWDSVQIEIADDYVSRRQLNVPELRLPRDESIFFLPAPK